MDKLHMINASGQSLETGEVLFRGAVLWRVGGGGRGGCPGERALEATPQLGADPEAEAAGVVPDQQA
jgi:hypothetical protein